MFSAAVSAVLSGTKNWRFPGKAGSDADDGQRPERRRGHVPGFFRIDVEQDLRTVLKAGVRTVMVGNGNAIIEPGYFEVFRKYSGRE